MTLNPKYRTDIDGLRAVAVLAVVAFHAFPKVISGGFIGVDVFFVISGFLISTILYENLERNQFSLIDFYSRRIRRIFPALILVLVFCFALGWFVLLPDEYKQLGGHMAGGAGFVQNFILWNEADYFDNLAETKPLLHLWSLGIEEQFYIVWPVLLWIAYRLRANLLVLTILIGLISFGLNIYGVKDNGTGTFYSPQTRFWELLIGAALAYVTLHQQTPAGKWSILTFSRTNPQTWASIRSIAGAALLITGLVLINKKSLFPGWWALLPTIGTALILSAGPNAWLNRTILSNKVLTWFGLISYPLYLWHWALLSFARILEGQTPDEWIRAALVVISIALSALTYYFIEKPIRFGKHLKSKTIILIVLMTIVGGVGYNTYKREGLGFRGVAMFNANDPVNFKSNLQATTKFSPTDKVLASLIKIYPTIDPKGIIAVWGDSMAQDWSPVFRDIGYKEKYTIVVISSASCPPILRARKLISPFEANRAYCHDGKTQEKIISFLQSIHPSNIFIFGAWANYNPLNGFEFLTNSSEPENEITTALVFREDLPQTLELLSTFSKVTLMTGWPRLAAHPGYVVDRQILPIRNEVDVKVTYQFHQKTHEYITQNARTQSLKNITYFDPAPMVCDDFCRSRMNGRRLYTDISHPSIYAVMLYEEQLKSLILHQKP